MPASLRSCGRERPGPPVAAFLRRTMTEAPFDFEHGGAAFCLDAAMTEPSDRNERATSKPVHIPTVLAVGCSDVLLSRCWEHLAGAGVMVRDCEPARAATLAAARHPLVIVVERRTYDLDAEELRALARDVRAALLPVDEDAGDPALGEALRGALRSATRGRARRSSSGRYSLLPGELVALPAPVSRSEPPPVSAVRVTAPAAPALPEDLVAALR